MQLKGALRPPRSPGAGRTARGPAGRRSCRPGYPAGWHDRYWETTAQLNTPLRNINEEKDNLVEVVDPTHPLFGRSFPLISYSTQSGAQYVLVLYQQYMGLRIPILATNLMPVEPNVPTKLTFVALQELISLAQEVICQPIPETSGEICPQNYKSKSLPNSRSSSRK